MKFITVHVISHISHAYSSVLDLRIKIPIKCQFIVKWPNVNLNVFSTIILEGKYKFLFLSVSTLNFARKFSRNDAPFPFNAPSWSSMRRYVFCVVAIVIFAAADVMCWKIIELISTWISVCLVMVKKFAVKLWYGISIRFLCVLYQDS